MAQNNHRNFQENSDGFQESIIQIRRVSKKTKGGNQMTFSVLTVVGDKKGRVGIGLGKGPDVASAIRKGFSTSRRNLINVELVDGRTLAHEITHKFGASRIMIKPAVAGTGMIAGGAVRTILESVGVKDVVAKILGTNNKTTNVYCTIDALMNLKKTNASKK